MKGIHAEAVELVELRSQHRNRVFLGAQLYFNNKHSCYNCIIRDISESGYKVLLKEAVIIPKDLELYIEKTDEMIRVTTRWQRGVYAGLLKSNG